MAAAPRVMLTINGQTRPLVDWAQSAKIDPKIVRSRIDQGWEPQRAVFTPQMYERAPHSKRRRVKREAFVVTALPTPSFRPTLGGFRSWPIEALDVLRRVA